MKTPIKLPILTVTPESVKEDEKKREYYESMNLTFDEDEDSALEIEVSTAVVGVEDIAMFYETSCDLPEYDTILKVVTYQGIEIESTIKLEELIKLIKV